MPATNVAPSWYKWSILNKFPADIWREPESEESTFKQGIKTTTNQNSRRKKIFSTKQEARVDVFFFVTRNTICFMYALTALAL